MQAVHAVRIYVPASIYTDQNIPAMRWLIVAHRFFEMGENAKKKKKKKVALEWPQDDGWWFSSCPVYVVLHWLTVSPFQFAYRTTRGVDVAVGIRPNLVLHHLAIANNCMLAFYWLFFFRF